MVGTALVGSTGLTGSHMLNTLLAHPSITTVAAFSRKPLTTPDPHSRLRPLTNASPQSWPTDYNTITPAPSIFYSALGTTRAQAGSLAAQRSIDYDLNLDLAKAAKAAGTRIYVLISVGMASSSALFPYSKMKGQLEDAVCELGFEKVVLVKPGVIIGPRDHLRAAEYALQWMAVGVGKVSGKLKDPWAQDAGVIGRAAVRAGVLAMEGQAPEGRVWNLEVKDILRLGREEQ